MRAFCASWSELVHGHLCGIWGGGDGRLSLALVIDCHVRELLGWQLSHTAKASAEDDDTGCGICRYIKRVTRAAADGSLRNRSGITGCSMKYFQHRTGRGYAACRCEWRQSAGQKSSRGAERKMRYFRDINFHAVDYDRDAEWIWLSNNVDFIYSCVVYQEKIKAAGIAKLNIYLGAHDHPWDREVIGGITAVKEMFSPSAIDNGREFFERSLSDVIANALYKLSSAGCMDRLCVGKVEEKVLSTNFVYSHVVSKFRRGTDGRRFVLSLETEFESVRFVLLDVARDAKYRLLNFWPSPWVALMKLQSAEFTEDGRLQVVIRWHDGSERERWGRRVCEVDSELNFREVAVVGEREKGFEFEVP